MKKGVKILVLSIVGVVLLLVWAEMISLFRESGTLSRQNSALSTRLSSLQQENEQIERDIQYYQNPANLEKVLREKFNYKEPGEHMIIVVPNQ
jgi:cell division protein FtsB